MIFVFLPWANNNFNHKRTFFGSYLASTLFNRERKTPIPKAAEQVEAVWQHTLCPSSGAMTSNIRAYLAFWQLLWPSAIEKHANVLVENPVGPQTSCVFVPGSWVASHFTSPVMSGSGTQGATSAPTRARVPQSFLSYQINNSFWPVFRCCFSISFCILVFLHTCEMSPPKSFPKYVCFKCTDVYLLRSFNQVSIRHMDS